MLKLRIDDFEGPLEQDDPYFIPGTDSGLEGMYWMNFSKTGSYENWIYSVVNESEIPKIAVKNEQVLVVFIANFPFDFEPEGEGLVIPLSFMKNVKKRVRKSKTDYQLEFIFTNDQAKGLYDFIKDPEEMETLLENE